jgi:hypothetical protein
LSGVGVLRCAQHDTSRTRARDLSGWSRGLGFPHLPTTGRYGAPVRRFARKINGPTLSLREKGRAPAFSGEVEGQVFSGGREISAG